MTTKLRPWEKLIRGTRIAADGVPFALGVLVGGTIHVRCPYCGEKHAHGGKPQEPPSLHGHRKAWCINTVGAVLKAQEAGELDEAAEKADGYPKGAYHITLFDAEIDMSRAMSHSSEKAYS